jgi:copper(I)-binding protein
MKPITLPLALALASLATTALAKDYKLGALEIEQPWARATPKAAKTAAGYVVIKNTGSESDRLTGGSLADAGGVQIHDMKMEGGMMKMRPLPDGVEIRPGETLELKPGGLHLMFSDLKTPLIRDHSVAGSLTFAKAGNVDVTFDVKAVGASQGGDQMQMEHMKMQ